MKSGIIWQCLQNLKTLLPNPGPYRIMRVEIQKINIVRMKLPGETATRGAEGDLATNSQAKEPVTDEALKSWIFSSTDEAIPTKAGRIFQVI